MLINKQYFKEMTLRQKLKYLLQYYGIKLIIGAVILFFVIYAIMPFFGRKNYDAYCLVLNDMANSVIIEHIEMTFPEYLNDEKYLIKVDNGFEFFYIEEEGINWPTDEARTKFFGLPVSNEADIFIADYNTMLWAVHMEFITPIESILPIELLEELKPYFVFAQFKGQDGNDGKVYGLDISETEVYKGRSVNYENAVLLIPNVTSNPEAGINFIKYCFGL